MVDVAGTYVAQLIVNDGFASSAPSTVTVTADSMRITLTPSPLNLSNAPATLTVGLTVPAGPNGLVVTLSGFDPALISVATRVTIPANATGANVTVTPLAAGNTNILATSPGYQPASTPVNITAGSITVTMSAPGVGIGRTLTGTITLSAPAPAGGTIVGLSATPGGLVTFNPTDVNIAADSKTGTFVLTGARGRNSDNHRRFGRLWERLRHRIGSQPGRDRAAVKRLGNSRAVRAIECQLVDAGSHGRSHHRVEQ